MPPRRTASWKPAATSARSCSPCETGETMNESPRTESAQNPQVVVVGPNGVPVGARDESGDGDERSITEMVEQPAKVMRIGGMIRQLLEEVKSAPLDEASRARLREIHASSIKELEDGLAPELVEELERLSLP